MYLTTSRRADKSWHRAVTSQVAHFVFISKHDGARNAFATRHSRLRQSRYVCLAAGNGGYDQKRVRHRAPRSAHSITIYGSVVATSGARNVGDRWAARSPRITPWQHSSSLSSSRRLSLSCQRSLRRNTSFSDPGCCRCCSPAPQWRSRVAFRELRIGSLAMAQQAGGGSRVETTGKPLLIEPDLPSVT